MPAKDGTGPMGQGPKTGRGFGPCVKVTGRGFGRGIGRGYGPCSDGRTWTAEEEKEHLKETSKWLEQELSAIKERLKEMEKK